MAGSQPYSYRGPDFSLQRDKNRFVLPAKFRNTVRQSSGDQPVLVLAKHHRWTCLIGYGLSRVEDLPKVIEQERERAVQAGETFDYDKRLMALWNAIDVPFDGSGRFVLPGEMATIAHIENEIYFHGSGEFFMLWAPEELAKMDDDLEFAKATCAALAAKERAKAKRS